jgi:hypothetical protein
MTPNPTTDVDIAAHPNVKVAAGWTRVGRKLYAPGHPSADGKD